jgi:hypothetical protein
MGLTPTHGKGTSSWLTGNGKEGVVLEGYMTKRGGGGSKSARAAGPAQGYGYSPCLQTLRAQYRTGRCGPSACASAPCSTESIRFFFNAN